MEKLHKLVLLLVLAICASGLGVAEEDEVFDRIRGYLSGENIVRTDETADGVGTETVEHNYPVGTENTLRPMNPGVKQIALDDPSGRLEEIFGEFETYIVGADTVDLVATLTADVDPETAYFLNFSLDEEMSDVTENVTDDGYSLNCAVDSLETTGRSFTFLCVITAADQHSVSACLLFRDEQNADAFVSNILTSENQTGSWSYVECESVYIIRYVDQNGAPVEGVVCQVCDETTCQVFVSDENGICEFSLAPYAWEVHTLKTPDGYAADTVTDAVTPAEGGEITFMLTKMD